MRIAEVSSTYENRVKSVASAIIENVGEADWWPSDLDSTIALEADRQRVSEYKLGGNAWREFVKDVKSELRAAGYKHPPREPRGDSEDDIGADWNRMAVDLVHEIANVFPDGDPGDAMERVLTKHGFSGDNSDAQKKLLKAFKEETGFDDLMAYCASMWDDYAADNGIEGPNPYA